MSESRERKEAEGSAGVNHTLDYCAEGPGSGIVAPENLVGPAGKWWDPPVVRRPDPLSSGLVCIRRNAMVGEKREREREGMVGATQEEGGKENSFGVFFL